MRFGEGGQEGAATNVCSWCCCCWCGRSGTSSDDEDDDDDEGSIILLSGREKDWFSFYDVVVSDDVGRSIEDNVCRYCNCACVGGNFV